MIFNMKTVAAVTAATLSLGYASSAMAGCVDNCPTPNTPTSQLNLQVSGASIFSGNVGSIFEGSYGSNKVTKDSDSKVDISTKLSGLCGGGDCLNTSLSINLMAMEKGSALTTAGGKTSGAEVGVQNTGQFNTGTMAGIKFGNDTTEVKTSGAAAFANFGTAKATGTHVKTDIISSGSGGSESNLKTQGDACPTCADFSGGSKAWAKSAMSMQSVATGNGSGQMIGIANHGKSEAVTQTGSLFSKNTSN